jgi:hypothetical protein
LHVQHQRAAFQRGRHVLTMGMDLIHLGTSGFRA